MKRLPYTMMVIMLVFLIGLAACSADEEATNEQDEVEETEDEPTEEESEPAVEEEQEVEQEPEYENTYPLTGIGTNEEVGHRAFGVMIENSLSARPQTGLNQADVVYEVLSEGTITRLLAFYHSEQPDRIGPVRSARDYYIYLNNGYDAMYVSAGGSPQAFELFQQGAVAFISGLNYDGVYFSRSSDRRAPHNMYTTYDDLVAASEHYGYDTERMPPELPFAEDVDRANDEFVTKVEINYGSSTNNVQYEYDEEEMVYIRSVGGTLVNDQETDEPVAPKNLFIVEADHRVIDDVGRRHVDIESGGKAYLIQEGMLHEVEWQNEDGVILPYKDGDPMTLLPGQTFINIVPSNNGGIEGRVTMNEGEQS
ncbi:DUF3048 domain-containing protein [Bacillus shivajii]|uniref:DUF3048 domain-containing protein n=1 Tax=Bacillus shivajii TaxID=1983719 RepID=UPI001CF98B3A|nr:DUF3048 domain-containing protein [Bacillus shivajii]UCZ53798.1 DUF3048 domain-containing protein [Bacillus shivajii]